MDSRGPVLKTNAKFNHYQKKYIGVIRDEDTCKDCLMNCI